MRNAFFLGIFLLWPCPELLLENPWGHLGLSWAILMPPWNYLGPYWAQLGPILGCPAAILAEFTQNLLGQILRNAKFARANFVYGLSWAIFGPSWGHLGAMLGLPGATLPRLYCPPISVRISKTCVSSMRKACFLESSHLGCVLSYCWSILGAILGHLGLSWSPPGAILCYIGPI